MRTTTQQHGFTLVPILLMAVIIGLVGFVGWRVYDIQKTTKAPVSSEQKTVTAAATVAPITNTKDIEKVQATLDTASVDNDLDASSLDQDLNDLL